MPTHSLLQTDAQNFPNRPLKLIDVNGQYVRLPHGNVQSKKQLVSSLTMALFSLLCAFLVSPDNICMIIDVYSVFYNNARLVSLVGVQPQWEVCRLDLFILDYLADRLHSTIIYLFESPLSSSM